MYLICWRGQCWSEAAPGYQPHAGIRRHKRIHKHIFVLLTICLVPFYDAQEENSVDWLSRRGKDNESTGLSFSHTLPSSFLSLVSLQVCAQVYEAHEGARLQREECVWCSPHPSRPALWFPTPSLFTAGAQSPQNTLSGSGGRCFARLTKSLDALQFLCAWLIFSFMFILRSGCSESLE